MNVRIGFVSAVASVLASGVAFGWESPAFSSANDFGIDVRLKALAAKAGSDWRETAEKSRTTGLEKLSGADLKTAVMGLMRKYAVSGGPHVRLVGGEPMAELGEISEGAFRGMSERYGWALWTDFFRKDLRVDDPVVAAKLLAGFERGVAGVNVREVRSESEEGRSEVVDFSPRWCVTPFQTGTYRTTIPGGYFESSWSNTYRQVFYTVKTSAKKVNFHVMLPLGIGVGKVWVNGREPDFGHSQAWYCDFAAEPDEDGVIRAELIYAWGGRGSKSTKEPQPVLALSFDGKDPAPIRSENVTKTKGLVGDGVHLATNSVLEFSSALPGFMTEKSGTFMMWFKPDRTYPSCHVYHDSDKAEDGSIQWIDHASYYERMFFTSGGSFVCGGVFLYTSMGPLSFVEQHWCRRILGGEWHLLALSYDAGTRKYLVYADGVPVKAGDYSGDPISLGKTFTLASGGDKPGMEGVIDEVKILPYALDEKAFKAEYCKHRPIRYELHDWSVGAGETKAFRFRAHNESGKAVKREVKVEQSKSRGEVEERISISTSLTLSLAPNELKDFTVDVTGDKPGLFEIVINAGEPDAATFECLCLETGRTPHSACFAARFARVIAPYQTSQTSQTSQTPQTLLGTYDCTKAYPTDRVALCASEVVTNGSLVYLESRDSHTAVPLAAYRFWIKNQGRPHIVEMDYPDDRIRNYVVAVYPEKWGRLYTKSIDGAGVMTGIDYPLSGKMQTKKFVFWPDSETVSVVVQNLKNNGHNPVLSEYGEHPAACAAVRLYELESLPPGPVQGMAKDKRSVYEWDEDPTIDASLTFSSAFNFARADLEFWRVKWQRIIDYMRWNSEDAWIIKGVSYHGDVTGLDATIPEASLPWGTFLVSDGRCYGWAELGADMLSRNGLGFWLRINHRVSGLNGSWFNVLGGAKPSDNLCLASWRGGSDSVPNILLPAVRNAYKRIVAAYRDKFGGYPGFKGVTMNEAIPVYFRDINHGYDDYTIACFRAATGIEVPMMDARGRFRYLTGDPDRKAKWIAWRCEETARFAEELVKTLRGGSRRIVESSNNRMGDGLEPVNQEPEIQLWIAPQDYSDDGEAKWSDWDAETKFLEAGVDMKRLCKIPGLRVAPSVRPDFYRHYMERAEMDEPYFQDSPSWVKLLRESGVDTVNVMRHSNFEIYPSMGCREAAVNPWKTELWLPTYNILAFSKDFQNYTTPHPRAPYTLDSVASVVADTDPQDFLTGFWGLMENGEHDEWRRFYGQFRSIPRGRYALVKGPDDPVAVRSGEKGHYLVNREPYPVTVAYVVDGKPETLELAQHEIRFVEGRGANGAVEVKKLTIPPEELATHRARLEKLENEVKVKGEGEQWKVLSRAAKEARAAFDAGRYHQFRALFNLGAVRRLFNPTVFAK